MKFADVKIIYLVCSYEFCLSLWFVIVKKIKAPTPTTIGTRYIKGCVIFDIIKLFSLIAYFYAINQPFSL